MGSTFSDGGVRSSKKDMSQGTRARPSRADAPPKWPIRIAAFGDLGQVEPDQASSGAPKGVDGTHFLIFDLSACCPFLVPFNGRPTLPKGVQ